MGFQAWLSPTQTDKNGDRGQLDVTSWCDVTVPKWFRDVIYPCLMLTLVAKQLLWAYLQNGMLDFTHFWQAGWYCRIDFLYKNSSCDLLEGFFFTMATVNRCHGNRSGHVFSVTNSILPAKFGARLSINGRGVARQTHTLTLLVL